MTRIGPTDHESLLAKEIEYFREVKARKDALWAKGSADLNEWENTKMELEHTVSQIWHHWRATNPVTPRGECPECGSPTLPVLRMGSGPSELKWKCIACEAVSEM